MSAYVLVLVFLNSYGISMTSIDYNSKSTCEQAGTEYLKKMSGAKYICLERI